MRREGRQHGLVRTCRVIPSPWNPKPDSRLVNRFDSPPTSGLFTKVPTKPNNHSKFTGKCGKPRCTTCHLHPASKSKDKSKGTHKLNSRDMVSNYKLITWRVVDGQPGLNFSGFSASGILDHLGSDDYLDDDCDGAYEYDQQYDDGLVGSSEVAQSDRVDVSNDNVYDDDDKGKYQYEDEDYVDDRSVMSFCDVGMVFDQVIAEQEEDWCLVGET